MREKIAERKRLSAVFALLPIGAHEKPMDVPLTEELFSASFFRRML